MKIPGLFAVVLAAVNLFVATPVATSVTARQRYPWNGKVDIVVTLAGESNDVAQADCSFAALINNCTTTWTTRNGVYGRLVTGKGAFSTKSIFLPAASYGDDSNLFNPGSYGYYWSSTSDSYDSRYACYLYFDSGSFGWGSSFRCEGQSVRPLRGFAK